MRSCASYNAKAASYELFCNWLFFSIGNSTFMGIACFYYYSLCTFSTKSCFSLLHHLIWKAISSITIQKIFFLRQAMMKQAIIVTHVYSLVTQGTQ